MNDQNSGKPLEDKNKAKKVKNKGEIKAKDTKKLFFSGVI